ncbi:PDZ domain-containing protein [Thalassotalea sp. M1531]|uniref:PDZ domain-containing protein n=1 Tax=Thalassotalea algicola TaxID=2716224 RepID=A0A7Y0LCC9_9GAMM|nr:trypsin-like peptidase domain-containing protein [Thalassotalea algicola]NMP31948.1 PDZ domain-containing protein [Thalassotalea algicola]
MKLLDFIKYIVQSASYGVLAAVILILLVPELRTQLANSTFVQGEPTEEAPLSYAKAVNRAGPAVVNIYSTDINNSRSYARTARNNTRLGSGVIMDANGYILTNYHVVQNADLVSVWLQNGQRYDAVLIGFDIFTDLAVLKVEATNLPVIPQREDLDSLSGDVVLAIGNPLNLGQTVTQGIISAIGRNGLSSTSYLQFLQMDAAINEGNSGGALVNTNGELVGINSRKFTQRNPQLNVQGIFFAVPYKLANKIMQKIIEQGRVIRGWLGVDTRQLPANNKGFIITAVTPNSPAFKAGLKIGDLVYQIDDIAITDVPQALDIVAETPPGTTINIGLYRKNQALTIPVVIAELNTIPK